MKSSAKALLFLGLLLAIPVTAADFPAPTEGDVTMRDFHFTSGEALPELRISSSESSSTKSSARQTTAQR